MLVEMDAAPDRAADGRVLDKERQRLVGNRIADSNPPPVRLRTIPLRHAKADHRVTPHGDLLAAVHTTDRRVLERGREMAQPVTASWKGVLGEEDDGVALSRLHRPVPQSRSCGLGNLEET